MVSRLGMACHGTKLARKAKKSCCHEAAWGMGWSLKIFLKDLVDVDHIATISTVSHCEKQQLIGKQGCLEWSLHKDNSEHDG
jgi:hypothetical protein